MMYDIEDYLDYIRIELKPIEVEGEKHCFSMTVKVVLDVFNSNKTVEIAQDEWHSINACDYMNPNGPCTCIGYKPYSEKQVFVSEQMGFVDSLFMVARKIAENPGKYYKLISRYRYDKIVEFVKNNAQMALSLIESENL